jgi:hypothetical protein
MLSSVVFVRIQVKIMKQVAEMTDLTPVLNKLSDIAALLLNNANMRSDLELSCRCMYSSNMNVLLFAQKDVYIW